MRKAVDRGQSWIKNQIRRGFGPHSVGLTQKQRAKIILADAMASKRRTIRKKGLGAGSDPRHNAGVRRFATDRARKFKKCLVHSRAIFRIDRGRLMQDRIASPILDALDRDRVTSWKRVMARRYRTDFPRVVLKDLNFLDEPIKTVVGLQALSRFDREEVNAYIDFEDEHCRDMGVFLVIAEFWDQLSPIFGGGKMSLEVQKVLSAVGLRKRLGIGLPGVKDHRGVWAFPIRHRRTRGTTKSPTAQLKPQDREGLNDALIELIDEWMDVASSNANPDSDLVWELSDEGKSNIANMVAEILDNAERHSFSGGDGDWSMAAFMIRDSLPDGAHAMRCHLAFLSVGRSIAETIRLAPAHVLNWCNTYANGHANSGQSWETLVTIAALQDGVSSSLEADGKSRGGTGLQDTLDFVGALGGAPDPGADVKVTIVSGKSCIRLRHPILVGTRKAGNRRVQWCNAANDPIYPPDPDIAFDLPAHFAGTLVSIAFTLDTALFVPEGEPDGNGND